eukprot:4826059-Pleurochrysis_carterae.AAC.5
MAMCSSKRSTAQHGTWNTPPYSICKPSPNQVNMNIQSKSRSIIATSNSAFSSVRFLDIRAVANALVLIIDAESIQVANLPRSTKSAKMKP